jgi:hypothetical protein
MWWWQSARWPRVGLVCFGVVRGCIVIGLVWSPIRQGTPPSDDVGMPVSVTVGPVMLRVAVPILEKAIELLRK